MKEETGMKNGKIGFVMFALLVSLIGMESAQAIPAPPLPTVAALDLNRYSGTWYEIASIPQRFQRGCFATQATYTPKANGVVEVFNQCRKGALDGKVSRIRGKAWRPDRKEPGKLRVQFFWPFSAKYWVIDLGENYEYAVVGHPNRGYLWILSRTPTMDERLYDELLARAKDLDFDISRVEKTPQP
jgi:apolipoprotein D and lipocalin family protein